MSISRNSFESKFDAAENNSDSGSQSGSESGPSEEHLEFAFKQALKQQLQKASDSKHFKDLNYVRSCTFHFLEKAFNADNLEELKIEFAIFQAIDDEFIATKRYNFMTDRVVFYRRYNHDLRSISSPAERIKKLKQYQQLLQSPFTTDNDFHRLRNKLLTEIDFIKESEAQENKVGEVKSDSATSTSDSLAAELESIDEFSTLMVKEKTWQALLLQNKIKQSHPDIELLVDLNEVKTKIQDLDKNAVSDPIKELIKQIESVDVSSVPLPVKHEQITSFYQKIRHLQSQQVTNTQRLVNRFRHEINRLLDKFNGFPEMKTSIEVLRVGNNKRPGPWTVNIAKDQNKSIRQSLETTYCNTIRSIEFCLCENIKNLFYKPFSVMNKSVATPKLTTDNETKGQNKFLHQSLETTYCDILKSIEMTLINHYQIKSYFQSKVNFPNMFSPAPIQDIDTQVQDIALRIQLREQFIHSAMRRLNNRKPAQIILGEVIVFNP